MSPGATISNRSDEESPATARADFDFAKKGALPSRGLTNVMNQEGQGSNSQQISAAIIKKIQNNYQVSVTNAGYDSSMTTASAHALNSITMRLKNESASVLPYLHALQEISEVYPQNQPLNTLLSQIHQGISTMILSKEDQIQQSHALNSSTRQLIQAKEKELKQA